MRRLTFTALLSSLLCGCGAGSIPKARYALEGSLSVVMELGWDEAFLETPPGELGVRFVRKKGSTEDIALKLVWLQGTQTFNAPASIDLAEADPNDSARQRSVVSRNVLGDARRSFPNMARGELILLDQIKADTTVRGQLHITFQNGVGFANGRTIYGSFSAKVPP